MNQEQRQFIASTLLEVLRDNANNRITNALMEGAVGQLDRQIQQQYPEPQAIVLESGMQLRAI